MVRPESAVSLWRTPRTRALLILGTLGVAAALVALAARIYTDALWFREVGHDHVYWTTLLWKVLTPAVAGLGTACFVLANLAVVERTAPAANVALRRLLHPLIAIAAGILSFQLRPDDGWRLLALWANRGSFGVRDPLFDRDVGFFVFSLPLYQQVARWLLETLLMAGVATAAAYALAGGLREARAHARALGAVALLVLAWRLRLDQYALALPHAGNPVPGASYTDAHVRLPILRGFVILSIAGAVLCAYAAVRPVPTMRLAVPAAIVALLASGANWLPGLVQHFEVEPQALSRERPYVADAIAATRAAFDLDRVDVRPIAGNGQVSDSEIAANQRTLANVPLWDAGVLRPAMDETQSLGGYYHFPSTTVDRYTVDDAERILTVAPRLLDLEHLPAATRTWATTHFAYTHGYGVVAVRAGAADADRYPSFTQREFRTNPLGLTEPRIYIGERGPLDPPWVVVNSGRAEVGEPSPGSQAPDYHYDGDGGIALSSSLRRAAFAARFGDLKLLLTETVTPDSRILMHRGARERVTTLAPFLRWDGTPQTIIAGGRVQFLFHGYTTSASYPFSARVGGVNYVRASALAVVDGFSGRVSLYSAGAGDPILRAWGNVFPRLFLPAAQLPSGLRAHLRYPQYLFQQQSEAYATYHADDPTGFWNDADEWQRAQVLTGPIETAGEIHFPDARQATAAAPSYLLARLPGDSRDQFVLATSYTPRGRQNLVGYLAGSIDAEGRPQLTLLNLPRDKLTIGPSQATRQMLAAPKIVERLQILNLESRDLERASLNRTILGDPRLLPVGDALVHVQPVYVTAGGSGFPQLQLVMAYANGRAGHGRDVAAALRAIAP